MIPPFLFSQVLHSLACWDDRHLVLSHCSDSYIGTHSIFDVCNTVLASDVGLPNRDHWQRQLRAVLPAPPSRAPRLCLAFVRIQRASDSICGRRVRFENFTSYLKTRVSRLAFAFPIPRFVHVELSPSSCARKTRKHEGGRAQPKKADNGR